MQRILLPIIVALTAQPAVAARHAPKSRSVEVIAMGLPAPLLPPALDAPGVEALPAIASNFHVHILRRRWIKHQPRASFRASESGTRVGEGDPFPPVGIPPIMQVAERSGGWPSPIPPLSTIVAPSWMAISPVLSRLSEPFTPGCVGAFYRPSGLLPLSGEERRRTYFSVMSNIACEYGVPVALFDALIIRESQYQPAIYSPKLAYGLTQLMPDTARTLGVDRLDPVQNLRGGARYLRAQLDRFGQYHLALAAYNAGPGRVRGGLVPNIPETQAYVSNVIENWSRLSIGAQQASEAVRVRALWVSDRDERRRQVALTIF